MDVSLHFSQNFYCGGTEDHVYGVALPQIPRHTVEYVCWIFSRAPCIHGPLHRLATKSCEKCRLGLRPRTPESYFMYVEESEGA